MYSCSQVFSNTRIDLKKKKFCASIEYYAIMKMSKSLQWSTVVLHCYMGWSRKILNCYEKKEFDQEEYIQYKFILK